MNPPMENENYEEYYINKYGATLKQLLKDFKNLSLEDYKELLAIKEKFPDKMYCIGCGAFTGNEPVKSVCFECGTE